MSYQPTWWDVFTGFCSGVAVTAWWTAHKIGQIAKALRGEK